MESQKGEAQFRYTNRFFGPHTPTPPPRSCRPNTEHTPGHSHAAPQQHRAPVPGPQPVVVRARTRCCLRVLRVCAPWPGASSACRRPHPHAWYRWYGRVEGWVAVRHVAFAGQQHQQLGNAPPGGGSRSRGKRWLSPPIVVLDPVAPRCTDSGGSVPPPPPPPERMDPGLPDNSSCPMACSNGRAVLVGCCRFVCLRVFHRWTTLPPVPSCRHLRFQLRPYETAPR